MSTFTVLTVDTINGGVAGAGWTVANGAFPFPGNIQTAPASPSLASLGSYGKGVGIAGVHGAFDSAIAILSVNWLDDGTIPVGATILGAQMFFRASGEDVASLPAIFDVSFGAAFGSGDHTFVVAVGNIFDQPWQSGLLYTWYHENGATVTNGGNANFVNTFVVGGIGYQAASIVLTNNPLTGVPLTRSDIFSPSNGHWGINVAFTSQDALWTTPFAREMYLDQMVFQIEWDPPAGYIGSGGVVVGGAAVNYMYTGSGGVLVGEIGSGTTPIVVSKDPSGMYTLVPDQHFDRVYTRNVDPDDTTDVAIPTPFAKTGYFGR